MGEQAMRAILVNVDFTTGQRAGGCCWKDKTLVCHPTWQNEDAGIEIRLAKPGCDLERFRDKPGVVILEGEDAINAAIRNHMKLRGRRRFAIFSESILAHSLARRHVSLDGMPQDPEALLERLYDEGVLGIAMSEEPAAMTAAEMARAHLADGPTTESA